MGSSRRSAPASSSCRACVAVMFWLNTPGRRGRRARHRRRLRRSGGPRDQRRRLGRRPKFIVRVYCVICVRFTGPMGSPMLLLWPNAPLRAVPE